MNCVRATMIAGLAALGAMLAGCGGPSDEERAMRERAIEAEARAAQAQAQAAQLAMAPAPTPSASEAPDPDAGTDGQDDANAVESAPDQPMDDTMAQNDDFGDQGYDHTDDGDMGGPPPVPMVQPPASIDVPRPDPQPGPAGSGNVEYVQVKS